MIIGADPGVNGGLVVLNKHGELIEQLVMPKIGNEIDISELRSFLLPFQSAKAYIEDVHAIFGCSSSSTFNFGRNLGILEASIGVLGISYVKVKPMVWQKYCFEGVREIKKPKVGTKKARRDTKAMALVAVKRLYPNCDLTLTERSKKFHGGLTDSLLIAHFGLHQGLRA